MIYYERFSLVVMDPLRIDPPSVLVLSSFNSLLCSCGLQPTVNGLMWSHGSHQTNCTQSATCSTAAHHCLPRRILKCFPLKMVDFKTFSQKMSKVFVRASEKQLQMWPVFCLCEDWRRGEPR